MTTFVLFSASTPAQIISTEGWNVLRLVIPEYSFEWIHDVKLTKQVSKSKTYLVSPNNSGTAIPVIVFSFAKISLLLLVFQNSDSISGERNTSIESTFIDWQLVESVSRI